LRAKERDYRNLQDQLLQLEQSFNRINEEKRRAEEDFRARLESNNALISNLRKETEE